MDYIIFGIGSGATLTVLGWLLRQFGPGIRDRQQAEGSVLSASELVLRMSWARFCVTCGTALVLCGCIVMVVALAAMVLSVGDDQGGFSVVTAFALSFPLMLIWLAFYLRRFGSMGILRRERKERVETRDEANIAPSAPTSESSEPENAEMVGVAQDEPTFSQAVSAPGGLGRFSAFFRKEDTPASTPDDEPESSDEDSGVPEDVTAAVIAAISGPGGASDKRLDTDDPLVTSVMGETEALEPAYVDSPTPTTLEASAAQGDARARQPADEEAALRALREKRKRRLSGPT